MKHRIFIIANDLSYPAGGPIYARKIVEQLLAMNLELEIWTRSQGCHAVSSPHIRWQACDDYFRHGRTIREKIRRRLWELKLLHHAWRSRPWRCLIVADHPRLIHMALGRLAPTMYFLHSVGETCPQDLGVRYLPVSRSICRRKGGLACLAADRIEHCLGQRPMWRKWQHILKTRRRLAYLGRLGKVIANSRYTEDVLSSHKNSLPIAVLEPLIENLASNGSENHAAARNRQLLYLGRVEEYKGALDAIRILAELPEDYRLAVAGDGSAIGQAQDLAASLHLSDRVQFLGWLERKDLAQALNSSGLLLATSLCGEAFFMAGPEALCAGVPVVAYESGGMKEWSDGQFARSAAPGDIRKAAQQVLDMTQDFTRWYELSMRCRALARTRFDPEIWRQRFATLITCPEQTDFRRAH